MVHGRGCLVGGVVTRGAQTPHLQPSCRVRTPESQFGGGVRQTGADHRPALSDNEQRAVPRTPAVAPEVTRGCGGVKWPVGPAAWPCVCSSGPLLCLIAAVASPLGQLRRCSTTRESQQHPAASVKGGQWTSPVRQWREQCASTVAHVPARVQTEDKKEQGGDCRHRQAQRGIWAVC